MGYTLTESGEVLTETQEGITMPADYSFATVNDYIHGPDVTYENLEALCLGMAAHIETIEAAKMTTGASSPTLVERGRERARMIELAAQMARRRGMPEPDDWPGWGARVPEKLWRAARDECDKASAQCADWAHELRKIADAL